VKIILLALFITSICTANANYHTVGWTNMFIPGGGRLVMGEYKNAAKEAGLEIGTFGLGYSMSPDSSFTLDGTPIGYPSVSTSQINFKKKSVQYCSIYNSITKKCLQYGYQTSTTASYKHQDASKALTAAFLQEFGIKYHMTNVFLSYRDQFNIEGGDPGQGIDQRSIKEMAKDPFRYEVLSSPWVFIPIGAGLIYAIIDYRWQMHAADRPEIAPINFRSKAYLAFDQLVMYPIGSSFPEETFYRGFIQNEFYYMWRSPYFSIPMSSALFALSHAQDDWAGAFVTGLYQGMLAYKNNGDLSYGNAVHFWGVAVLGLEALVITLNSQAHAPPASLKLNFSFE
jgi:hypothetical protein